MIPVDPTDLTQLKINVKITINKSGCSWNEALRKVQTLNASFLERGRRRRRRKSHNHQYEAEHRYWGWIDHKDGAMVGRHSIPHFCGGDCMQCHLLGFSFGWIWLISRSMLLAICNYFTLPSLQDLYLSSFSWFPTSCPVQYDGFGSSGLWAGENHGICSVIISDIAVGHKQCHISPFYCIVGSS